MSSCYQKRSVSKCEKSLKYFKFSSYQIFLGEHLAEEFTNNVNRFQRLPCIIDNGFKLSESVAIARYICREYKVADHWYPKDSKLRAKVDEYLEWQHLNTRANCAFLFRTLWINTKIFGKPADPKTVENLTRNVNKTLDIINDVWLKDQQYIAGNEISIADLFAATEILQTSKSNTNDIDKMNTLNNLNICSYV